MHHFYRLFFVLYWMIAPAAAAELKTLVLVIDSEDKPAYAELREVWRSYSRLDPPHFEVYFIRGNPALSEDFRIVGDILEVKSEEGFRPGILNKTVLALASFEEKLKTFDYVLRTNLSSFYAWPQLLDYLHRLPRASCYAALPLHIPEGWEPDFGFIPFGSGAGFILSRDMAEKLVKERGEMDPYASRLPDDVAIGLFFYRNKIPLLPAERQDFSSWEEWELKRALVPKTAYHFRAKKYFDVRKADEDFSDEVKILKELVKIYYR